MYKWEIQLNQEKIISKVDTKFYEEIWYIVWRYKIKFCLNTNFIDFKGEKKVK